MIPILSDIHRDKIVNPSKYYPNWDSLPQEQKKALLENIWPSEIERFKEEVGIFSHIIIERN
ncbi:MAG: hypothetical protein A2X86_12830 [Bdellovibrionales bacterium GWA2_49_15]|nr:MAG: hypothetical protein A2X86_12830 [Bdellovibrionales bacterium GWA2_49_15]HAZ14738.1 hypothetical protein [Bdellovibrionales bacterium]